MLYAYFGHHKAATKWMLNIIDGVCDKANLRHQQFHSPKEFDYEAEKYITEKKINFFSYTNANWEYIKNIQCRGFHIIRDPRDIMVSAYYSHLYSHSDDHWPELSEHRLKLNSLPKEEGLLCSMNFTAQLPTDGVDLNLIDSMYNWNYTQSNILEIKYENLIQKQDREFRRIFKYLGLHERNKFIEYFSHSDHYRMSAIYLKQLIDENSFSKLSGGRKKGIENKYNHYRKGLPGDWKDHFSESHKEYFKNNFGDLLMKLKYEKNNDW